jgi:C4-type Zn-finger protein
MAMADAHCPVCSGEMVLTLVDADPTNGALESRTYACADCGHSRTYSVDAGDS